MQNLIQEKAELENISAEMLYSPTTPREKKIVAEGDSWFAYPLSKDIIDHLRDKGYAIKKHSKAGDTLENMVYGTNHQIKNNSATNEGPMSLNETLMSVKTHKPRFVLFSAGGNDIVGKEFEQYLNHKNSGLTILKRTIFKENVHSFMKTAIIKFLKSVWDIDPDIDILMDGYDYAKPNGIQYQILSFGIAGPWLLPGFAKKNILNRTLEQEPIIKDLIDEYNSMLIEIEQKYPKFHHIDLRGKFPDESEWDNEIHLKSPGFGTVANLYDEKMNSIINHIS
jgi:lysophospholipase L1-like esterase